LCIEIPLVLFFHLTSALSAYKSYECPLWVWCGSDS
jgi:hypothetical protein